VDENAVPEELYVVNLKLYVLFADKLDIVYGLLTVEEDEPYVFTEWPV
jgi:hypothetical protein